MSPALYPTNPRPAPPAPSHPNGSSEPRQAGQAPAGSGQTSHGRGDEVAVVALLGYN